MSRIRKLISDDKFLVLAFFPLAASAALAVAYTAEYIFGLKPCHLCLYQRPPYFAIVIIWGLVFLAEYMRKLKSSTSGLLALLAFIYSLLFLVDAGIAAYHTGVEKGIFTGPESCAGNSGAQSADELLKSILNAAIVSCKDPAFVFLGLSMAAWNAIYAGVLGILSFITFLRIRKNG